MAVSDSVPELVAIARADAKASEDRISELAKIMNGQTGTAAQSEDLRAATEALERAAVDIFTVFEARMQHHFRRGPFSRKLTAALKDAGQADLADRVHQYYLAVNVMKHGKGASYRELVNAPSGLFTIRPADDSISDEADAGVSLVDVTGPDFFDGLTTTILEACRFLENR